MLYPLRMSSGARPLERRAARRGSADRERRRAAAPTEATGRPPLPTYRWRRPMDASRKLLAVLAHPDDESLGVGGTLAAYAAAGAETYVVTATRGERGRYFTNESRPSDEEVGRVREAELRAAAGELGARELVVLDYMDGDLDRADPQEAIGRIVDQLRRVRPHVVLTFDPFG